MSVVSYTENVTGQTEGSRLPSATTKPTRSSNDRTMDIHIHRPYYTPDKPNISALHQGTILQHSLIMFQQLILILHLNENNIDNNINL